MPKADISNQSQQGFSLKPPRGSYPLIRIGKEETTKLLPYPHQFIHSFMKLLHMETRSGLAKVTTKLTSVSPPPTLLQALS